jgi:hypothetical protein
LYSIVLKKRRKIHYQLLRMVRLEFLSLKRWYLLRVHTVSEPRRTSTTLDVILEMIFSLIRLIFLIQCEILSSRDGEYEV